MEKTAVYRIYIKYSRFWLVEIFIVYMCEQKHLYTYMYNKLIYSQLAVQFHVLNLLHPFFTFTVLFVVQTIIFILCKKIKTTVLLYHNTTIEVNLIKIIIKNVVQWCVVL